MSREVLATTRVTGDPLDFGTRVVITDGDVRVIQVAHENGETIESHDSNVLLDASELPAVIAALEKAREKLGAAE